MKKQSNNLLPLVYFDDPLLRKKAQPIEEITEEIRQLADRMIESMIHYNGVGLAAPQVGRLLRLYVIREELLGSDGQYQFGPAEVIVNPILSEPSDEIAAMSEGCLSIPGIHVDVPRPLRIRVRYQTLEGEIKEEEASGFRARVFMHENDHLNGVLFIDRLAPDVRKALDPELRAVKQKYRSCRK